MFSDGNYHNFLDVIEQFNTLNKGQYENALVAAQDSFDKLGKDVDIEYDVNIALVTVIDELSGRCSMILREPERTTTFNYSVKPGEHIKQVDPSHVLNTCAAFLEGIQLCYIIGTNTQSLSAV